MRIKSADLVDKCIGFSFLELGPVQPSSQDPLLGKASLARTREAARSRVLARLVSLAQIGELARRLRLRRLDYVENKEREVSWELCNRFSALWSSLYLHMNQTFLRFSMYKKGYNV